MLKKWNETLPGDCDFSFCMRVSTKLQHLSCDFCRIFWGEGVHQMFGGPIFEGRNEILLLGKALKFREIIQKYALKL